MQKWKKVDNELPPEQVLVTVKTEQGLITKAFMWDDGTWGVVKGKKGAHVGRVYDVVEWKE